MGAPATLADAGRVRSLRWWSDAALLGAADKLRRTLEPWAAGWGLSLHELRACNAAAEGALPAPVEQHVLAAGTARVWHGDGHAVGALAALLFGPPPAEARGGSALACELAARAWQDLLDALSVALPVAAAAPTSAIADAEHAWSGAVRVDFDVRGMGPASRFSLRLDAAVAGTWCAGRATASAANPVMQPTPLVTLPEVVAQRPVRVSVHLAAVELNLGELQSLAVGDVIRLPHRLDDPLQVDVDLDDAPSRTPLCRDHLAQRDGRVVAELVPSPAAR
jgi:hypothetical protein